MKLITFTIPSYNSEAYLSHAVDTIISAGDEVEIIIVNDGSTDRTAEIADSYAEQFPNIVRVIHKTNGGHGSGVNAGVENATGLYFKVVDSDDWVDQEALKELLATIRGHLGKGIEADLYITNYVYDHVQDNTQFVRQWRRHFPPNHFCTWKEAKPFYGAQVLLMHALLYKTEILRQSDTVLPEHTFYVDNYFAYKPLPFMRKLFYLDVDLYHYFIGRDDQSVNINNFTKRYDQQIRVMLHMTDAYTYDEIMQMESGLRRYMLHDLSAIMMNTLLFCTSGGNEAERKAAYQAMWEHICTKDPKLFNYLQKKGLPALVTWMPWNLRGSAMLFGYKVLCKVVKLG